MTGVPNRAPKPARAECVIMRPGFARTGVSALVLTLAMAAGSVCAAAPAPPKLSPAAQRAVYADKPEQMEKLAERNPLDFLRLALKWSDDRVTDYTCQFLKQEKIDDEIHTPELMFIKLRVKVFSIYVRWIGDYAKGQEALFVDGQNDGKVIAHPSGFVGFFVHNVRIDPNGKTALKHSRRPLTNGGMANMLRLVIPQCEHAKANGDLALTYEGIREQDGRPCYVFKRVLPNKFDYPCPVLAIFIDRQFLTCIRTDAYDWDGSLLSQYIYSNLVINPGLTDADFDADNRDYGFRFF